MTSERPLPPEPDPLDQDHVATRAELLPEEEAAGGSADPQAQARAILEDSEARVEAPHAPPDGPG